MKISSYNKYSSVIDILSSDDEVIASFDEDGIIHEINQHTLINEINKHSDRMAKLEKRLSWLCKNVCPVGLQCIQGEKPICEEE